MMSELVFQSVKRMAVAVRKKEVSSVELVEAHLRRIKEVNSKLNAVVELAAESALRQAQEADAALARGESAGPLQGVPMTVKGAWDCAGLVNTGGTLGRKGWVAQQDATVIARMKRAGMIPIGVTNLPEFSLAFESDNLVYGRTNNPYRLDRTPGGSGGGGAAAIATGCSPFEVGADLGGSIRVPAHFCGIAGLKPTLGRVPLTGYFPGPFGIVSLMATAGPMARYVEDLTLTLPLLSGPDLLDATVADAVVRSPEEVRVGRLRVAFHTHDGLHRCDAETAATVERAAKTIEDAGASVAEARPEGLERGQEIMLGLMGADGCESLMQLPKMAGTTQLSAMFQATVEQLKPYASSAARMSALLVERDLYRLQVISFFDGYDVILCPTCAGPAPEHGSYPANIPWFNYTMAHNLSGCPGAVVRCGESAEGLPIGVQIVAAPWREHVALAVAAHLESALGGWKRPPL